MKKRVSREAIVGNTMGYRIEGDGGPMRMAWVGSELYVSEIGFLRFDPPILFLKSFESSANWTYQGICESATRSSKISAEISQTSTKLKLSGVDHSTMLVGLKTKVNGADIELKTYFERGIGVVRQEQWNNGLSVVYIEWISGS